MRTLQTLAALASLALAFAQCQKNDPTDLPEQLAVKTSPVERGKYLMTLGGCDDCHTPKMMTPQGPVPDMSRRFMGHPADEPFEASPDMKKLITSQQIAVFSPGMTAAAGLWGTSYAANLTPDDTGTGAWTEAQFIKALREGKLKGLDGTRPLLPPMPWPNMAQMSDEDLKAIFAFLRTVKPVKNAVPAPKQL